MFIQNAMGKINISKEAISKIIGKSANATSGIVYMSAGVVENFANWLNGNRLHNGIELKESDRGLDIILSVIVQYRMKMPDVCAVLRSNVREAVESFTGLSIGSINIKVVGVSE
ncbi:Asp23/Gls24 family envelope stress response protein [Paenibacillus lentus]|uniref:Asp23/Gls24 family envelope stress response protein n=1 Tax=Paenibacillus lentus TaxID=1338368 RepID=UPI003659EC8D